MWADEIVKIYNLVMKSKHWILDLDGLVSDPGCYLFSLDDFSMLRVSGELNEAYLFITF